MPKYKIKKGQKHYMRGQGKNNNLFKGGDVIELSREQARYIADKLELVDDEGHAVEETEEDRNPPATVGEYKTKHKGGGRYDVLHPETGEAINDKPLPRGQAEELRDQLNEGVEAPAEEEEPEDESEADEEDTLLGDSED